MLALDGDACQVRRHTDDLQIILARMADMTVIHRETAQHPALRVEDRLRPTGAQPMTQCQFLKRLPKRVGGNVADDDPSPVESSRSARTHFGSDGYAVNGSIVFGWQVGPRAVPEV